ncbi:hypothetical protein SDC9_152554 [bioreactor metagenome]|uniref:Uncharacterized protein n=1 Tax=bioreactor metagenome TaxID=1076179 RepID=A0A645EY06_9ZZZZ
MKTILKYKFGDIVYIKAYLAFDYELGQIVGFNNDKNVYTMIHFLDNGDPRSFYKWCFIKEEDIELFSKVTSIDNVYDKHGPFFDKDIELKDSEYQNIYTDEYFLAEKVTNGIISEKEYFEKIKRLGYIIVEKHKR